jgi:DNA-binding transcriptional MerR regulator/uncharacterized protein YbaR (Trm112 family)
MKIGCFAVKFGVPIPTIRHYIDIGLLIPRKDGAQYAFESKDIRDMELIDEMKRAGFSLKELNNYINTLRMYDAKDSALYEKLIRLLQKKEDALEAQKQKINANIHLVSSIISDFESKDAKTQIDCYEGIHTDFLELFACPNCGQPLRLEAATVFHSNIISGKLVCGCCYEAVIEDGFLLTDQCWDLDNDFSFINDYFGDDKPAPYDCPFFEIIDDANAEYLSLQHKTREWMNDTIKSIKDKRNVILLPDLASLFLYLYHDESYLKDSLIILTGLSKNSMAAVRQHLRKSNTQMKIAIIISPDCTLPLATGTVDLMVDYLGSYSYSFFKNKIYLSYVAKYLSSVASIVGSLDYYPNNSKTVRNINRTYDNAVNPFPGLSHYKTSLADKQFSVIKDASLGNSKNPGGYFEYHIAGDTRHTYAYHAKREKSK